jgi:hypothetical protein
MAQGSLYSRIDREDEHEKEGKMVEILVDKLDLCQLANTSKSHMGDFFVFNQLANRQVNVWQEGHVLVLLSLIGHTYPAVETYVGQTW